MNLSFQKTVIARVGTIIHRILDLSRFIQKRYNTHLLIMPVAIHYRIGLTTP
jgi:hypothetical protein